MRGHSQTGITCKSTYLQYAPWFEQTYQQVEKSTLQMARNHVAMNKVEVAVAVYLVKIRMLLFYMPENIFIQYL